MSLINDALKQTKQAQQQIPPPNPPPLSPVESHSAEGLGWLVPGFIILLLVAAGFFVGVSMMKPAQLAASRMPVTNSLPAIATLPQQTAPAISSTMPIQKTNSIAVTPLARTNIMSNSSPIVVAPPKPAEPKLQGILFAAAQPCAIVSGRTVFVGDRVDDFRVEAISRDSITLRSETATKVLSLNPQ